MVCYRRYGHNEGDDPSYTQPLMYKAIAERRSVRKLYVETLVQARRHHRRRGRAGARRLPRQAAGRRSTRPARRRLRRSPRPHGRRSRSACCRTSRPASSGRSLDSIFAKLTDYPEGFTIHPKLGKQFEARAALYDEGEVDWATGEALAIGSLVLEGHPVRLAGQDSRRGTFSQRHCRPDRLRDRRAVDPARSISMAPRPTSGCSIRCCRSTRRSGFEYGYSPRQPRGARDVGGAVRRLHQRCADRHRPVHRRRRGQVGPAERPRAAAAARLRRPGSRAQLGAHRAVPHARGRGQHADRQHDDRGELLPPPAPPGALASVRHR